MTGPDPKGETHIVASEERVFSLLDPAFDAKQEQVFKTLTSNLNYDPWAHCSIEPGPTPVIASTKNLRDVAPLDVKSDMAKSSITKSAAILVMLKSFAPTNVRCHMPRNTIAFLKPLIYKAKSITAKIIYPYTVIPLRSNLLRIKQP